MLAAQALAVGVEPSCRIKEDVVSRRFGLGLALGVIVLAGGCGGDSASSTQAGTATQAVTKAAYIAKADSICKAANARAVPLSHQLSRDMGNLPGQHTLTDLGVLALAVARDVDRLNAVRAGVTRDLKALDAPASGGAVAYLALRDRGTAATRAEADAFHALAKNPSQEASDAASEAAAATTPINGKLTKAAEDFGFKACGQPLK